MSKTLEQLRAELGRLVERFHTGTATGGSPTTIVDTNGLQRWTEEDALVGGIAFIREDAGGAGALPEGEWRRITAFDEGTQTITLEYALSAAVAAGDTYELYLAGLALEDWDLCVNAAIREVWPEVWETKTEEVLAAGLSYISLASDASDVVAIYVRQSGARAGWPDTPVHPVLWRIEGQPGSGEMLVRFSRTWDTPGTLLYVVYKARYAELAAGEETDLDLGYLMAAARANLYGALAAEVGSQADASRDLQLMNFWQKEAAQRKQGLARTLAGLPAGLEGKKK